MTIPSVDLTATDAPEAIRTACEGVGFFYLKAHGVSRDILQRAREAAERFFSLPLEDKQSVRVDRLHRGYIGFSEARLSPEAEVDFKESFVWGMERIHRGMPLIGPNQWPKDHPWLREALEPYFEAVLSSGARLLRVVALALELPETYFVEKYEDPLARGSIIHYPPAERRFGTSAHSDYGFLTLLWQDDVGGLQVEVEKDRWLPVPPRSDAFVVNVGDLLALWTRGRFGSTMHRVVTHPSRHRYSMAVFFDPDHDTFVEPAGMTCGDYILSRFNDVFAYRAKP
jgi:isopenicillin N synthase-like dioxygenase